MALINCKECQREMSSDVKKCPHCGKDQRNWFMRHKILLFFSPFIALVLLIIVIGAIQGVSSTNKQSGAYPASSSNSRSNKASVTKENYDKIKSGMTKSEVISILGEPSSKNENEIEGLGKSEMWHFQEGFSMKGADIMFQNEKVSSKNWIEL